MEGDSTIIIDREDHIYTNSLSTVLNFSAENILTGVTEMIISEDPTFAGASWTPFLSQKEFRLNSAEDGLKTVYVRFKDDEGNISEIHSDTIILDTISLLSIGGIDNTTFESSQGIYTTTNQSPSFSGTAEPGSTVTITIHSNPITAPIVASDNVLDVDCTSSLAYGSHTVKYNHRLDRNSKEISFGSRLRSRHIAITEYLASSSKQTRKSGRFKIAKESQANKRGISMIHRIPTHRDEAGTGTSKTINTTISMDYWSSLCANSGLTCIAQYLSEKID